MKVIIPFLLFALVSSYGQNIVLTQSNESGIYKSGEKIEITASLKEIKSDSLSIKILKNFSEEVIVQKLRITDKEISIYEGAFKEATSILVEVRAGKEFLSIGLVVDPENFKPGTERPKDFDQYWESEKKALRAMPMDVQETPLPNTEETYTISSIEISCAGPKPVRGYFARPENAAPQSLPIVLFVRAAGVKGHWCQSKPEEALMYAKMGNGALAFDLNAHGMLVGQPQEYYDKLEEGKLKNYSAQGLGSRDEYYFRGMYLRLIRTLDFLCSQPEWDEKRILVIGESQGGGQSLAAAGLDNRVSMVVATVPAMCDWGATLHNSKGGWPNPFSSGEDMEKVLATVPYFDAAHLLKNSKASIVTEIGFIDYTCPPASIYAAINQSKGEKIVLSTPYRGHQLFQEQFRELWEETVYKPKMAYIEEYLK